MFASRLRLYTVHVDARLNHAHRDPLFIKEGFNFWAFLFVPFWTLTHRLWAMSAILFFAYLLLALLQARGHLDTGSVSVLQLGLQFITGFSANDWWRAGLSRRGYEITDIVAAESKPRAELRFFERAEPAV